MTGRRPKRSSLSVFKKTSKWENLEKFNSRKQEEGEDIEDFIQDLELIAAGVDKSPQDIFDQAVLGMTLRIEAFKCDAKRA